MKYSIVTALVVGAFSVIVKTDGLFEALITITLLRWVKHGQYSTWGEAPSLPSTQVLLKCAVEVHDVEFCHSLRQLVDHTIPALRELKEGTHSVTLYNRLSAVTCFESLTLLSPTLGCGQGALHRGNRLQPRHAAQAGRAPAQRS